MDILSGIGEESRITLPDGTTKQITMLNIGDSVSTINIDGVGTITYGSSKIKLIEYSRVSKLVKYEINHNNYEFTLMCTQDYPIFDENLKLKSYDTADTLQWWSGIEVSMITPSTKLRTYTQPHIAANIESITKLKTYDLIDVYSLSLEDGDGIICNGIFLKSK